MNKHLVLNLIEEEILSEHKFLCKHGKDDYLITRILELCDAYWELRGSRGYVANVFGVGDEAASVHFIELEWRTARQSTAEA